MARNDTMALAALLLTQPATPRTRKLTATEKEDLQASADLREIVTAMESDIAKEFPSMAKEHIQRTAEFTFGLALALAEDDDSNPDLVIKITEMVMPELAKAGKPWALAMGHAMLADKFKPAYDKAIKAGVDPAVIFQADFQMDADKARTTVEQIREAESEGKFTK